MRYGYTWWNSIIHTSRKPDIVERFLLWITGNSWWEEETPDNGASRNLGDKIREQVQSSACSINELANASRRMASILEKEHTVHYISVKREELLEKAKRAFCKSTCKGYQDIGRCLSDGHCDNFNQFVKLLE